DLELAAIVERAAWRDAIARASTELMADPDRRSELLGWEPSADKPPASQLGGLRQVLATLEEPGGPERATAWLAQLRTVENRKTKWPGDSLDKLNTLLTNPDQVWTYLELPEDQLVATEQSITDRRQELWGFAVRSLLGAAIRAQLRQATEPEGR
ncbi:MAG: hypothetical protein WHS89_13625, partial [Acidimicrobiales bacterium]